MYAIILTNTHTHTEQMIELHKGQGMDIHWRDTFSCPTEEQYKRMVIKSKATPAPLRPLVGL